MFWHVSVCLSTGVPQPGPAGGVQSGPARGVPHPALDGGVPHLAREYPSQVQKGGGVSQPGVNGGGTQCGAMLDPMLDPDILSKFAICRLWSQ